MALKYGYFGSKVAQKVALKWLQLFLSGENGGDKF